MGELNEEVTGPLVQKFTLLCGKITYPAVLRDGYLFQNKNELGQLAE